MQVQKIKTRSFVELIEVEQDYFSVATSCRLLDSH